MGSKHASKTKYIRRRIGKVDTPLNEKLENVEWGKFSYNVLFKLCAVKNMLTKFSLDDDGKVPVYSSESTNNGIIGYTKNEPEFIVNKENPIYIIFGDHTRSFNIATDSFCVTDNVKVLSVKEVCSIKVLLCIISSWKKCIPNIGYSRHWSLAKNIQFNLPISKNGKIDFEFMENFIADLETERIKKLEDYLIANGFDNYTLTAKEKQILKDFESEKIKFRDFEIQTLFEVSPSRAYKMNDKKILTENGKTPYVSNQSQDNGYIGWSNLEPLNPSNVITLSDTWQSERTIFYQNAEFIGKSHLQVMKAYDAKFKKFELFYVISSFRKAILEMKYDYGTKFNRSKIKTTKIQLPEKDNHPNYELMNTLISAIQKLVIKDVVLYVNNKKNG